MTSLGLSEIVQGFALALMVVDGTRPVHVSRTGRAYQPGIGPHAEDRAVELVLGHMTASNPALFGTSGRFLPYPGTKQKCDLWFGSPVEWAVEVKMARFFGDNGKPDDTSLKDLLSPYDAQHSALTDCSKLARSEIAPQKAVLIYGFDYPKMPLEPAIRAFETLASREVELGPRLVERISGLVHPVHAEGSVFGWAVRRRG